MNSVITNRYNNNRTGANLTETQLTTTNINVSSFGKLFERRVDGSVYAQPMTAPNININGRSRTLLFVATMHNSVYAFDATDPNASTPVWRQHLANSIQLPAADMGPGLNYRDISWEVGILSTPVIDTNRGVLWCVSTSRDAGGKAIHTLWKLRLTDGSKLGSINLVVRFPTASFESDRQIQRSALTLANGRIYIPFAAYGDEKPYHGWVLAYDPDSLAAREVFCTTPQIDTASDDGDGAGIWQAGQGPAVDAAGNLYVMTGNGPFNAGKGNYCDCVVKLSPSLVVQDYFTPFNTEQLDRADDDLGSGGILVIPGTNFCAGGGKESILYVLDQHNLGQFNNPNKVLKEIHVYNGPPDAQTHHIHGAPSYYAGPNGTRLYVWVENDNLKAFSFDGVNLLSTNPISTSTIFGPDVTPAGKPEPGGNFGMPGGFHTVSANGNISGTGLVWANHPYIGNANQSITPGILHVFNAYDLTKELWNSRQNFSRDDLGNFAKFCCPWVNGGRVYQATMGGLQQKHTMTQLAAGSPAMVNQKDQRLVVAWSNPGQPGVPSRLNVMSSPDGLAWPATPTFTIPDDEAASPPGLAYDPETNTTYIGWSGTDPQHSINIRQSKSPGLDTWINKRTTPEHSTLGVTLTFGAGLLFVCWVTANSQINIATTKDGGAAWLKKVTLGETTLARPSMTFHNAKLTLTWAGTDGQLSLLECTNFTTLTFANKTTIPRSADPTKNITSALSPALQHGPNDQPWLVWCDTNMRLSQVISETGTPAGFTVTPNYKRTFADTSPAGPGLCYFKGAMWVTWAGSGGSGFVNVAGLGRGSVVAYGLLQSAGDGSGGGEL